jgi:2-isopropylmalate synthase
MIEIYDTTLRDGMQGAGMNLTVEEKLQVVKALDQFGIDFIEAGFPESNPKDLELFKQLDKLDLKNSTITAFGMTRRVGSEAKHDFGLNALANTFAPIITLVGKTWQLHLEKVIQVTAEENIEMIADSIRFLRTKGKRVFYDAEHFFDGFNDNPDYALKCLQIALDVGAERIVLCDTNGKHLPDQISQVTEQVQNKFPAAQIGIHCHNDNECGVANSLAAVNSGAIQIQGTINGYGERCGNANLTSIIPILNLKMNQSLLCQNNLADLTHLANFIADLVNLPLNVNQAYVGKNAFAHKGGMHIHGVEKDATSFEHIDPEQVGNQRDLLASELSGKATVINHAQAAGLELDDQQVVSALENLKEKENQGFQYDAAEASFEILLRKENGSYQKLFELINYQVTTSVKAGLETKTWADVTLMVQGQIQQSSAVGNGPVNALDRALRQALVEHYPKIEQIELTGYRVRILDSSHGTTATTRVLLDSTNQDKTWSTTGVSENIIEASWQALVDSLEYAFQKKISE